MKVTIACLEPLRRLFRSLDPAIAACGFDTLPAADAHAPLMSLPKLLGTCLADVPANVPYFRTDALAPALLRTAPPPRIGLVWAGRPEYRADRTRSFSPEVFRRLVSALAPVGARLFSLQVGARRSDLRDAPAPILDLGGDFSDFADTAAAIDGLDLLISIDSAVAHLAGALGRPVWVMLAYVPEWRWLEGRSDSPWYPTMRLFRQPRAGDWESVIADLKAALPAAFPSAS
jgi:hypothetical protein